MDPRSPLVVAFGFGVALQAVLLLRGEWNWLKLAGCALFASCIMIPDRHEDVYRPLFHVLMCFSTFSFLFAVMFKDDILQVLNVPVVLSYTLVFWFAFFAYFYDGTLRHQELAALALIPSAFSVVIAARRVSFGFVPKLVLYSWFLVVILCLGLMQFPFSQLAMFYEEQQLPWVTPAESFMAGMAFLFLLVNATFVFQLIPIPGRRQSWADRMKEWHQFTEELAQRMDSAQRVHPRVAVVLGLEGAFLALNYFHHWLSPALAINIVIVLPALLLQERAE